MTGVVRKPLLTIPGEAESSAAFRSRLNDLIRAANTHLYIDTSFLMWLTKIGSVSRQEWITWVRVNCSGRVHVPIWAAHEYLKHHVAGTIVTELTDKTNEVVGQLGRVYTYFRPFIDEAYGEGAQDPSVIRAATRTALNSLDRLATISRQWRRSYPKHASEVIEFINSATPETTSVYDGLKEAALVGATRFGGSVPPGFQDRNKGRGIQQLDSGSAVDGNRYGDLVFWREILAHAKGVGAKCLVVLTNDRKNDWYLGRGEATGIDPELLALRKAWKPVPRPHPMLVLEARLVAGAEQVELLDSAYLATLLRDIAEEQVRAFADVAIIPDGPELETDAERRARLRETRLADESTRIVDEAEKKGYLFPDRPEVIITRATLTRALLESRSAVDDKSHALLDSLRASVEANSALTEVFAADTLQGFDHRALVRLARELHDLVLAGVPGFGDSIADLVSYIDRMPPNTAAAIYLGLLASMYLVRETNASRLPPSSPVAQMLFDRQSADYAVHGVSVIAKRLRDNDFAPVYVPSVDCPKIIVVLDTEPDTSEVDQLRSMLIGDVELLTPAQADDSLKLRSLFEGEHSVRGTLIIRKACELFAMPEAQIEIAEDFARGLMLTATIGFKRPGDISLPKEV